MCDGPVAMTHNMLHWMGWHWQAPDSSRGRDDHTWPCWMDQNSGGFMKSDKDCVVQNGRKQEPKVWT